jgi:uncharacterized protein with von Willebrand factor type A (vWA) domain
VTTPDVAGFAAGFARALEAAGVPVPPGRAAALAAALDVTFPTTRTALYWTARVTLVSDVTQVPLFDATFAALFGAEDSGFDVAAFRGDQNQPGVGERRRAPPDGGSPSPRRGAWTPPALVARYLGEATSGESGEQPGESGPGSVLAALSPAELLRQRDLAGFTDEELAHLRMLAADLAAEPPLRRGRRTRPARSGSRVDLRATLRASVRTGGDPLTVIRRARRPARRRLVLLCDVSGSMEGYARAYLTLLAGAAMTVRAESFVFATRLTRITAALRSTSGGRALPVAGSAAPDWGGGTRLGTAVQAFLDGHGRRGAARNAVVVVLSDGWEAGDPGLLGNQMERLSRMAYRVIWVNPRVAAEAYQPLAGGMAAALPHVDRFLSGHTLAALERVLAAVRE